MKLWRIGYTYTEHGSVSVLAGSEDQAAQILDDFLEENGLENIDSAFKDYETHHRDYDTHKEYK